MLHPFSLRALLSYDKIPRHFLLRRLPPVKCTEEMQRRINSAWQIKRLRITNKKVDISYNNIIIYLFSQSLTHTGDWW